MGLSSKLGKPPSQSIPTVRLHLAGSQDQIFKPNDTVSGQVSITTPIPIHPSGLEVSLWGVSSAWIRDIENVNGSDSVKNFKHFRDNAPLFTLTHDAFNPSPDQKRITELLPGQTYMFPFQLLVPECTGHDRTGIYKQDTDERWTVSPHPLPPTFFWGSNPKDPDNAKIEYFVSSQLICPGFVVEQPKRSLFSGDWTKSPKDPLFSSTPIHFQPLNSYPNPLDPSATVRHSKTFTLQSSSLASAKQSSISLRRRIADRFSSATPTLDFEVGIEVPNALTSGSEFGFRTTFHALTKSDSVSHIPAIKFSVKEINLLDFTFLRVPRDWQASNTPAGEHRQQTKGTPPRFSKNEACTHEYDKYDKNKTSLNPIPSNAVVQVASAPSYAEKDDKGIKQERCEYWFTSRIPTSTLPSFKSFAISKSYEVKIKLVVYVGEKAFEYVLNAPIRHMGSA